MTILFMLTLAMYLIDAITQYDLLMDLYTSTNGSNWKQRTGWNMTSDTCTWFGITCVGGTLATQIALNGNGLVGTLPPSWANMTKLAVLYLHDNAITGSLPPSWGNITSLQDLYLYNNQLTGTLPPSWSNMPILNFLYLHNNTLTGSLPPSWGNISTLSNCFIYNNTLTGSLPSSWGNLTSLARLKLYKNQLTGSLPPSWANMNSLTVLDLTYNYLQYTVPSGWWQQFAAVLTSNCLDPPASNQRPKGECRFSPSLTFNLTNSNSSTETVTDRMTVSQSKSSMLGASQTTSQAPTFSEGGSNSHTVSQATSSSKSLTSLFRYLSVITALSTANIATIAAMTTALVGGGGTNMGLSSLQGAVGAMRLAYRCSSEDGDDSTSSTDPSTESSDSRRCFPAVSSSGTLRCCSRPCVQPSCPLGALHGQQEASH